MCTYWWTRDTLVGVRKMGKIVPRVGIEPISLALWASVLTITPPRLPMSPLLSCLRVYSATCLRIGAECYNTIVACWRFTPWEHQRSYHDSVTVGTHSNIALPTWYAIELHYPIPQPTSPCPILIMQIVWLRSDKCLFLSHSFDSTSIWICVRTPQSS